MAVVTVLHMKKDVDKINCKPVDAVPFIWRVSRKSNR